MGTVKRSRRRNVPLAVEKELELLILVLLLAVLGKETAIEVRQVKAEKEARAELEAQKAAKAAAAAEAEAKRLAEEEAKKLKTADNMPELSIEAEAACLFSIDDDVILYEKNGTEHVAPASTTKLLTALTVETFLVALLVPSGNDAACALANYTGKKLLGDENVSAAAAVEAFVEAMNSLAGELDLEDSNFQSPDGDGGDNQYTTARDMIRIARACLENETVMSIVGKYSCRALFDNMDVTYKNTNLLLSSSGEYYYEGTIGLKTGSFHDVKCLIGAVEADGRRYVTAVMQDSDEGRWRDTRTLFDEATGRRGANE